MRSNQALKAQYFEEEPPIPSQSPRPNLKYWLTTKQESPSFESHSDLESQVTRCSQQNSTTQEPHETTVEMKSTGKFWGSKQARVTVESHPYVQPHLSILPHSQAENSSFTSRPSSVTNSLSNLNNKIINKSHYDIKYPQSQVLAQSNLELWPALLHQRALLNQLTLKKLQNLHYQSVIENRSAFRHRLTYDSWAAIRHQVLRDRNSNVWNRSRINSMPNSPVNPRWTHSEPMTGVVTDNQHLDTRWTTNNDYKTMLNPINSHLPSIDLRRLCLHYKFSRSRGRLPLEYSV